MKNFSLKTKGSYLHNSKKRSVLKIIGLGLVLLLAVRFIGGALGGVGVFVFTPFYETRNWLGSHLAPVASYFQSRDTLRTEIHELEERLSALGDVETEVRRLTALNEEFSAALDIREERILAGVVARPPALPYDAVFIDRGSNDGIEEGAVVYHRGSQVVGVVAQVYAGSSLVSLLSTPGVRTTAYVMGPQIYTTAEGEGGGVIRLGIPQGIVLTEGDVVVMPSVEAGLIGRVGEIRSNPSEPEQYAFVLSEVPIQELQFVEVSMRTIEKVDFKTAEERVQNWQQEVLRIDVPKDILIDIGTTSASTTDEIETSTSTDVDNTL